MDINPLESLLFYVVFLFSVTLHEAAHAWAALRLGDATAYHGGQVTLDPRPHIRREPFGMVLLPLLSVVTIGWPFGFASAPYDPRWAMRHPKRAAWMALAGPASNMLLCLISGIAIFALLGAGVFGAPDQIGFAHLVDPLADGLWVGVGFFLSAMFSLNLLLAVFNLLPFPPLDGSGAVPLLLNDAQTAKYQQVMWGRPGLAWIGILLASYAFDFVFNPVWTLAINILLPGSYG
ncbi:MAG: site-2 protease family protein [Gemmatimonadales bacterium]|nr:MAG: site-2 protease family protein [Gemmatimonadales bacterium]